MYRPNSLSVIACASVLAFSIASAPVAAGIKCWKNKEGGTECGNSVPPEYAQKGHKEISEKGFTVKEQARAKTPEELKKEEEEAARLAAEEAERKRLAEEQALRDRVLLQTYTTEEELELARRGKNAVIESRIKNTESLVEKLKANKERMQTEAARLERSGKPVSKKLQNNIAEVDRQIHDNESFIAERRKEQADVDKKFETDLARYRELKQAGRH
jgi:23S rRNA maturation mini-RNase III